ncbi:MAG: hypothetical protein HY829_13495 [Actinobacteria bacterium]|nr:hypothetical protein [Actinomycetota bacterium]
MAQLPDWQQEICTELRELVWQTDPEIEETIKRTVQPDEINRDAIIGILSEIVDHNQRVGWRKLVRS